MEKNSTGKGNWAEEKAVKFLLKKDYAILERNWRFKKYEVDIIAKDGNTMVFVEVKSRGSDAFGEPETAVTRKKQRFLVTAADQYIQANNIQLESRFDIISILVINNNITVKHIEDAFYPSVK
ncbi:MAG: YraN family protein [Bacteroidetes bacterium]|nr:YraN family protein [Bacteroidota bacterium]